MSFRQRTYQDDNGLALEVTFEIMMPGYYVTLNSILQNTMIFWGDGTSERAAATANHSHKYTIPATYTIKLYNITAVPASFITDTNILQCITSVVFKPQITSIGDQAFYILASNSSVEFQGLLQDGGWNFEITRNLTIIGFENLTSIGSLSFANSSFTNNKLTLGSNLTAIKNGAFSLWVNDIEPTPIDFSQAVNLQELGEMAFRYNKPFAAGFETFDLRHTKLSSLGRNSFFFWTGIKTLYLPATYTDYGWYEINANNAAPFAHCQIEDIYFAATSSLTFGNNSFHQNARHHCFIKPVIQAQTQVWNGGVFLPDDIYTFEDWDTNQRVYSEIHSFELDITAVNANDNLRLYLITQFVEWGDGQFENTMNHSYAVAGDYRVKVYTNRATITNSFCANRTYPFAARLMYVTLSNKITEIESFAFSGNEFLVGVNDLSNIRRMGNSVFSYCARWASDFVLKDIEEFSLWNFYGCGSELSAAMGFTADLRKFNYKVLPNATFYGYSPRCNIKRLLLGDGLKEIAEEAIIRCSNLSVLDLPSSLEKVGTIMGCSGLRTIVCRNKNMVVQLGGNLQEIDPSLINVYVPDSLVGDYQIATNWSQMNIKPLSTYVPE